MPRNSRGFKRRGVYYLKWFSFPVQGEVMSNLTYRELKRQLNAMSEEWLDANVTIYLTETDEWFPVKRNLVAVETDVLDEGHPYLEVDG